MVLPTQPPHPAETWTGNISIPQWTFFSPNKFDIFHVRSLFYLLTPKEVASLTGHNGYRSYTEEAYHVQDIFSDVSIQHILQYSDVSRYFLIKLFNFCFAC